MSTVTTYVGGIIASCDPDGDVLTSTEVLHAMLVAGAVDAQGLRCANTKQILSPHDTVGIINIDSYDPGVYAFHRDSEVLSEHPLVPISKGTKITDPAYVKIITDGGMIVFDLDPIMTRLEMALELRHLIRTTESDGQ